MTILYIKTHNKTGLKYFGKTQKSFDEFLKYNGSGKYWIKHLKKHGVDISTRIYAIYDETDEYFRNILNNVSLLFSIENDIVESDEWANLQFENGLDGTVKGHKFPDEVKAQRSISMQGEKHWNFGKKHSEETKLKIKEKRALQIITEESNEKRRNAILGIKRSDETREKMSRVQIEKPRVTCPHCGKVGAHNLMTRYHFDNCKTLIKL